MPKSSKSNASDDEHSSSTANDDGKLVCVLNFSFLRGVLIGLALGVFLSVAFVGLSTSAGGGSCPRCPDVNIPPCPACPAVSCNYPEAEVAHAQQQEATLGAQGSTDTCATQTSTEAPLCTHLLNDPHTDLMKHEEAIEQYNAPRIYPVPGILSLEEINWLLSVGMQALTFDKGMNASVNETIANYQRAKIPRSGDFLWLYERIHKSTVLTNDVQWQFRLPRNLYSELLESMYLNKYDASINAHYDWHSDIGVIKSVAKRRLSMYVPVNALESYEGGDFELRAGVEQIATSRVQPGVLYITPSYMQKRVTPVTKGVRYELEMHIQSDV